MGSGAGHWEGVGDAVNGAETMSMVEGVRAGGWVSHTNPSDMQMAVTFLSGGEGDTHLVSSNTHQYLGSVPRFNPLANIMGCSHTKLEIGNPLIYKTQCSLI